VNTNASQYVRSLILLAVITACSKSAEGTRSESAILSTGSKLGDDLASLPVTFCHLLHGHEIGTYGAMMTLCCNITPRLAANIHPHPSRSIYINLMPYCSFYWFERNVPAKPCSTFHATDVHFLSPTFASLKASHYIVNIAAARTSRILLLLYTYSPWSACSRHALDCILC
jgi:hypothetical protein